MHGIPIAMLVPSGSFPTVGTGTLPTAFAFSIGFGLGAAFAGTGLLKGALIDLVIVSPLPFFLRVLLSAAMGVGVGTERCFNTMTFGSVFTSSSFSFSAGFVSLADDANDAVEAPARRLFSVGTGGFRLFFTDGTIDGDKDDWLAPEPTRDRPMGVLKLVPVVLVVFVVFERVLRMEAALDGAGDGDLGRTGDLGIVPAEDALDGARDLTDGASDGALPLPPRTVEATDLCPVDFTDDARELGLGVRAPLPTVCVERSDGVEMLRLSFAVPAEDVDAELDVWEDDTVSDV